MRIGLVTEAMIHLSLDGVMDWLEASAPDVRDLEVATGGYSPPGHSPLAIPTEHRSAWLARIVARGFRVCALNVSGNPLHPDARIAARHDADLRDAIRLSAELGIDRVVAMSGCPASEPGTAGAPHFAANAWLPDYAGVRDRQFERSVSPYWQGINELLERDAPGVTVCLELHPGAHVFNVDTFLRLNAAAPRIGANLDSSHLFWQGMDPIAVIDRLGAHIAWSHGKDVRYHPAQLALNGLLDALWPGDPQTIGWDFAAVGRGAHDAGWWSGFCAALARSTRAEVISIEHEDRLEAPEAGIRASLAVLSGA